MHGPTSLVGKILLRDLFNGFSIGFVEGLPPIDILIDDYYRDVNDTYESRIFTILLADDSTLGVSLYLPADFRQRWNKIYILDFKKLNIWEMI